MFILSAPSWRLRKPRPRKRCPDRLIMALYLQPNSRFNGIRLPIIRYQDIKVLGLMHHDTKHLRSDLYQPILMAPPRTNPSSLEGERRSISQWATYLDAKHDGVDDVLPATTLRKAGLG